MTVTLFTAIRNRFHAVWRIDNIEKVLLKVFNAMVESDVYYGDSHLGISFFRNLSEEEKPRAVKFLNQYLKANAGNVKKIKMVISIVRNSLEDVFDDMLLFFLKLTQDVNLFKQIPWRGTMTSGSGDIILADVEMADWKRIENIVAKSTVGLSLIPIKKYISDQIDYCQQKGDKERQQKFISGI